MVTKKSAQSQNKKGDVAREGAAPGNPVPCPNCEVLVADLSTPAGLAQARGLLLGAKPVLTIDLEVPPCCDSAAQTVARLCRGE